MKDILRNIDFISKEESLRIDKKNRYKNIIGGIISFFISFFSVVITLYFSSEIIYLKDPKIISSKGTDNKINNYTLSKDDIQFFISLEYSNASYYVDESVYTVTGKFTEIYFIKEKGIITQKFNSKEIKLIRCKDMYSQEEILKNNLKLPIHFFYCVKPENPTQIGGVWGSQYFSKVEIFVNKCKNDTLDSSDKPCKPLEEINNIIENGFVSIYTTNYFIDNWDNKSPIQKTLKNNFDRISNKFKMNYIITYSTNFYNNDIGWLLPSYEVEKFPSIEDFKISQQFGDIDKIIQIQLQTIPIRYNYIRSYVKIQDVLVKIGGCIKALILIGISLNFFYSQAFSIIDNIIKNHNENLSNKLEIYDINKSSKGDIKKKIRIEFNKEIIRNKIKNGEFQQNSEDNINQNENSEEKKEKQKKRDILISKSKIYSFFKFL